MVGLVFEGDALSVAENEYEAGMYNGKPYPAGVARTINVLNGTDVLKLKVAKGVDLADLDTLKTACATGERVKVRLDVEFVFGKLQAFNIASAAA